MSDYELLNTTGFHFAECSVSVALLTADFGDGYGDAALAGSAEGLRAWQVEIELLPDLEEYPIYSYDLAGETRAKYLYNFFLRSKAAGNKPFILRDPSDGQDYFAEFVDHTLTRSQFTSKLFSASLSLRQRRVRDYQLPGLETEEVNPNVI